MPQPASYPTSVAFYENAVPDFVDHEIKRLYSNLFSTLPQLAFREASQISTYVSCRGTERVSIILFAQQGPAIQVLNEGMSIGEDELLRFASAAFSRYPRARVIRLHAVCATMTGSALPCQQHPALDDIVLTLPETPEAYLASLGKSTRSYINRYLNKLQREYPSFRHEVLVRDEIEESLIHELIALHKARMSSKDKVSVIDDKRLQEILQLVREYGFAVVARVDGKVCAGTINYHVGDNYFLETVAHDSAFNDYRIGTLCSYLTVRECIARGGREYHFLWGDYDYKFRLGGVRRELKDMNIYRSKLGMILCSDFALKTAARRSMLDMKTRLLRAADQDGNRLAQQTVSILQKGRDMLCRLK